MRLLLLLVSSCAKAVKGLRGFDLEDPYGVYVKRLRERRTKNSAPKCRVGIYSLRE